MATGTAKKNITREQAVRAAHIAGCIASDIQEAICRDQPVAQMIGEASYKVRYRTQVTAEKFLAHRDRDVAETAFDAAKDLFQLYVRTDHSGIKASLAEGIIGAMDRAKLALNGMKAEMIEDERERSIAAITPCEDEE